MSNETSKLVSNATAPPPKLAAAGAAAAAALAGWLAGRLAGRRPPALGFATLGLATPFWRGGVGGEGGATAGRLTSVDEHALSIDVDAMSGDVDRELRDVLERLVDEVRELLDSDGEHPATLTSAT